MPHMPVGRHVAKVRGQVVLGRTSKGKEQIVVQFENAEGQHATWYGFFSSAALPYTLERLETCGWDGEADGWNVSKLHRSDKLAGNEVELVIEEEEYDGKKTPKIRWINEVGGGAVADPMDSEEASRFGEELAQTIRSEKGPAEPEKKDDGYSLDDIPF